MLGIKSPCLLFCPGSTGYKISRAAGNRACRRYCLWERRLQILWSTEAPQIKDSLCSSNSDRNINTLDIKTPDLDDFHYKIQSIFSEYKSKLHQVHKCMNEMGFVLQGVICSHVKSL